MSKTIIDDILIDLKFEIVEKNLTPLFQLLSVQTEIKRYYNKYLERLKNSSNYELTTENDKNFEKYKNTQNKQLRTFIEDKYKDITNIIEYNLFKKTGLLKEDEGVDCLKIKELLKENTKLIRKQLLIVIYGDYCPYYKTDNSPQEEILKETEKWKLFLFDKIHK